MEQRESFVFYRSFFEAIEELEDDDKAIVYSAISEYALNQNEIILKGIPLAIFKLIKPQLDANIRKYQNGKKGGRPRGHLAREETKTKPNNKQTVTKTKSKDNQNDTKSKPNVNENVNENINDNCNVNFITKTNQFEDREFIFKEEVFNLPADTNDLEAFFNYWSEPDKGKNKMRFEMEKTWDTKRRLTYWVKNNQKFTRNGKNSTNDATLNTGDTKSQFFERARNLR